MDLQNLEIEILTLRHELHQLQIKTQGQENKIIEQASIINKITIENQELKNKLLQLQDKLNINSSNSGLPTSKEVHRIERKSKPKSRRKPGGQKGHKYSGYQFKTPDKVIDVVPEEKICACGGELVIAEEYQAHQKIEIPPIKPFVTEYRLRSGCCTNCKKIYDSKLNNYKLLEKNVESIIAALSGFFNNSKREVQSILSQIFNLDISLGLVSNSEPECQINLRINIMS